MKSLIRRGDWILFLQLLVHSNRLFFAGQRTKSHLIISCPSSLDFTVPLLPHRLTFFFERRPFKPSSYFYARVPCHAFCFCIFGTYRPALRCTCDAYECQ
ncbi:hypothetical protein GGU11DRAFT_75880 [Lentinula aff. detonsa]|nr:hypothetical protein GGU11DRAFT_75880 [Lentinula aff. detonsa]